MLTNRADEIADTIRRHFHEMTGIEPAIGMEALPLNELGLDSMAKIDLVLRLEADLGLLVPFESSSNEDFKTLGNLTRLFTSLHDEAEPGA